MRNDFNYELCLAKEAVSQCFQLLKKTNTVNSHWDKLTPKELKSDIDLMLNSKIIDCMKSTGINIISEESGSLSSPNSESLFWVIDPLDGTFNYVRKIYSCGISIALVKGSEIILGVVGEYPSENIYYGGKKIGSYLNGNELSVSKISHKNNAVICSGFPSRFIFSDNKSVKNLINVLNKFSKVRMFGSAALSLCAVAKGVIDAYYEDGIMFWDVAAGIAIVEGAGGAYNMVPCVDGESYKVYASNGLI